MQYLVTIAVVIFLIIGGWAVSKIGLMKNRTISQHVAKSTVTIRAFQIFGTIAALLASYGIFFWLLPSRGASVFSYVVFGIVMTGFLIAALVPLIPHTRRGWTHLWAAWGMCYVIPFAMFSSLFWTTGESAKMVSGVLLAVEIILLVLFSGWRRLRDWMLYFQVGYLMVFFGFLVVSCYG